MGDLGEWTENKVEDELAIFWERVMEGLEMLEVVFVHVFGALGSSGIDSARGQPGVRTRSSVWTLNDNSKQPTRASEARTQILLNHYVLQCNCRVQLILGLFGSP